MEVKTGLRWSMEHIGFEMSTGHQSADVNRLLERALGCIPAIPDNQEVEAGESQA